MPSTAFPEGNATQAAASAAATPTSAAETAGSILRASSGPSRSGQPALQNRRTQRVVPLAETVVASPNGKVRLVLMPNAERLTFAVQREAAVVIEPSALRLLIDGYDLGSGVIGGAVTRAEHEETYPLPGVHRLATDRWRGATIALTHDLSALPFRLEVRAFDDGVAYRWVVPGDAARTRTPEELSEFVLPAGTTVWYHNLDGHYETEYAQQDAAAVPAGQWAGPPVTFALPGGAGFGTITEANLVNYAGMGLEADGRRGWIVGLGHRQPVSYPFELRYGREEARRLARPAAIAGEIVTPWRVVLVSPDLNGLVNSDVVTNLCPPADPVLFPQGFATPWVRPGTAVWRYTDGGENTFAGLKQFSTWAQQLGARYHILEGTWSQWTEAQIREIVAFSRQQGVGLLFWRHSRQLRTAAAQDEFFDKLQEWGVAGAKIDFFDHEAKELVDLYEVLLRKAAERQLVLNFHGANKPTGRMRTWPNELVREGIRGMEASKLPARARHETILPFTRYLAGPADYTTMHFGARRADTTWAHQIACLATFQSPLLTIAAHPESVLKHPAADVIKSIPAVWDETIVLPAASIGEVTVFARRSGAAWTLAVMNAHPARTLQVPLSFLGAGRYRAVLVRDDPENDAAVRREEAKLDRTAVLTIELRAGGGFIAWMVPLGLP